MDGIYFVGVFRELKIGRKMDLVEVGYQNLMTGRHSQKGQI